MNCVNSEQRSLIWVQLIVIHDDESGETIPKPNLTRVYVI